MIKQEQVGCGYCHHENYCDIKERKNNFAKMGCPCFCHWQKDIIAYSEIEVTNFINKLSNDKSRNNEK